jgi:hypothetical protein
MKITVNGKDDADPGKAWTSQVCLFGKGDPAG